MKREDLKKLGLEDAVIDSIMGLHGADIETHKTKLTEAETARDQFKTQLDEANTKIESFTSMNVDQIKAEAADYKTKYEQAQTEHANQLAKIKFDSALDKALAGAKAKNAKAVTALLSTDALKLNDDGTIAGLEDQLTKIKTENEYLFADTKEPPKIITGGGKTTVVGDSVVDAARMAAGLPVAAEQGK